MMSLEPQPYPEDERIIVTNPLTFGAESRRVDADLRSLRSVSPHWRRHVAKRRADECRKKVQEIRQNIGQASAHAQDPV